MAGRPQNEAGISKGHQFSRRRLLLGLGGAAASAALAACDVPVPTTTPKPTEGPKPVAQSALKPIDQSASVVKPTIVEATPTPLPRPFLEENFRIGWPVRENSNHRQAVGDNGVYNIEVKNLGIRSSALKDIGMSEWTAMVDFRLDSASAARKGVGILFGASNTNDIYRFGLFNNIVNKSGAVAGTYEFAYQGRNGTKEVPVSGSSLATRIDIGKTYRMRVDRTKDQFAVYVSEDGGKSWITQVQSTLDPKLAAGSWFGFAVTNSSEGNVGATFQNLGFWKPGQVTAPSFIEPKNDPDRKLSLMTASIPDEVKPVAPTPVLVVTAPTAAPTQTPIIR